MQPTPLSTSRSSNQIGLRPMEISHEAIPFPSHNLSAHLLAAFSAYAQDSMDRWKNFDFAKSSLKPADLANVPLEDLTLMRGIVFGRHGRVFKDATIRTYLERRIGTNQTPTFKTQC